MGARRDPPAEIGRPAPDAALSARGGGARRVLPPIVVVAATAVVYAGSLRNGFVDWDDQIAIVSNPHIRGLTIENVEWAFTTFHLGPYQPLAWISLTLDHAVWGLNPLGYHLTSAAIHAANALLVYLLALALFGIARHAGPRVDAAGQADHAPPGARDGSVDRWSAALAALLFALHPLRVESVAWATERRDVLCGFFSLATVLFYVRPFAHRPAAASDHAAAGDGRPSGGALACFVLALLAKASAMTLPVVLLALDAYPLRRMGRGRGARRALLEKAPFVAAAGVAAVVAFLGQAQAGAMRDLGEAGILDRARMAAFATAFYAQKTLVPAGLSPLYEAATHGRSGVAVAASVLFAIVVAWLAWALRRRAPAFTVAAVCYLALLAPVSGLVSVGSQAAADRYTYLPGIGWAIAAAAVVRRVASGSRARAGGESASAAATVSGRTVATTCSCAVIAALALGTVRQIPVWRDSTALWTRAAQVDPRSPVAQYGLGFALSQGGRLEEAVVHYRQAIALEPDYIDARVNLGTLLGQTGDLEGARAEFEAAAEAAPRDATIRFNLGLVAARRGRVDEAIAHYRHALTLRPTMASPRVNLSLLLAARGDRQSATALLAEGLAIAPGDSLLTSTMAAIEARAD
jgi:Flp pilus assembly protein TadD